MNLNDAYTFLNFWINKEQGAWYSPPQLDLIVDRAQMSLWVDYYPKYGTSMDVRNSLAPFRTSYDFTNITSPVGLVTLPASPIFLKLIDMYVVMTDLNGTHFRGVEFPNDDERVDRINSQIIPLSLYDPFGEVKANGVFQLWPNVAMAGRVNYFRRPAAPVFNYSLVSGRVIVYNPVGSTQLEWNETDQNMVLIKALSSIGINIGEQDIMQFAENKDQLNINTPDRI